MSENRLPPPSKPNRRRMVQRVLSDGTRVWMPAPRRPTDRTKPTKRHNGMPSVLTEEQKEAARARGVVVSYVYAIGAVGHPIKIGYADHPRSRLKDLQVGNPSELRIYVERQVAVEHVRAVERECHLRLDTHRLRGEWFDITPERAAEIIDAVIHAYTKP